MQQKESSTSSRYPVSQRRTPTATQFKPGQSGNPKGRPKGAKGLDTLFDAELNQTVTIVENGQQKQITKRQAVVKQNVNKAMKGDMKAISLLLDYIVRREASKPLPQRQELTEEQFVFYARQLKEEY